MYDIGDIFFSHARRFGDSLLAGFPAVVVGKQGNTVEFASHDLDEVWIKRYQLEEINEKFYPVFGLDNREICHSIGSLVGFMRGTKDTRLRLQDLSRRLPVKTAPAITRVYEDHLRRPVLLVKREGDKCLVLPFQLTCLELACVDWETFVASHSPTSGMPVRLVQHLARYALHQGAAPDAIEAMAEHIKFTQPDIKAMLSRWGQTQDGGQAAARLVDTALIMPAISAWQRAMAVDDALNGTPESDIVMWLDLPETWSAYVSWRKNCAKLKELKTMVASLKFPASATTELNMAEKKAAASKKSVKPKGKVVAAAKTAASSKPAAAGKTEKKVSTSSEMQRLILEGKLTDDQIFAQVQKQFSLSDDKRSYVAWYRNKLTKSGVKVPAQVK